MADPLHMSEIPEPMLRAWADAHVISSARYVDEMVRRGKVVTEVPAPPIEPDLDDLLGIDLDLSDIPADPLPPADYDTFEARPLFSVVGWASVFAFGAAFWAAVVLWIQ